MKTVSLLAFAAAAVALVALTRLEFSVSVLFTAGFIAIALQDYGRRQPKLPVAALPAPRRRKLQAQFRPPALCLETNRLAA